jgi:VanZ family protein
MLLRITLAIIIVGICYLSISPTDTLTIGNDKTSHFIAYSTLMFNVGLLTYLNKPLFIRGVILSILFGGVLEIVQHFVPGRVMSILDLAANTVGVFLGVILTIFLYKKVHSLLKVLGLNF